MQRSYNYEALVINVQTIGENNNFVTLLTAEKGIIRAILYGGPKSKMRSLVAKWNCGNVWLYENPEKNQIKITDFEIKNFHNTFSENLYKSFAASLAAELAIKTHCAGSARQCFKLINGFFDGMELCNEAQSKVGLIRFLWRYLELLGIRPQTTECSFCNNPFFNSDFDSASVFYYNKRENNFICRECATSVQNKADFFPINANAVFYLSAISALSPAQIRKIQISKEDYAQIREIAFFLIENCVEQKLNSIEIGIGIL